MIFPEWIFPFERQKRFLLQPFEKKKNCVFHLCQGKDCQATVELNGDDVPYLVTCIWGWHNNDIDLMKLHAETQSGRKWHLEKTSGFLLGLSRPTSQENSRRQTRAKGCLFCHKWAVCDGLLQLSDAYFIIMWVLKVLNRYLLLNGSRLFQRNVGGLGYGRSR